MTVMSVYREKKEAELYEHLKKATNDEDVAPKQKHVRWCILYTWDHSTCKSVWDGLKGQPILSNGLLCFKALIVIHKMLVDGPHLVLAESLNEMEYIDSLSRQGQYSNNIMTYSNLLHPYIIYIKAKLAFHEIYPEFNGKFDFKDHISRSGNECINRSYEMIVDLLDLLSHILKLQHLIGSSLRGSRDQTCLQGALIPLVEESDGIYKFATKILETMFTVMDDIQVLIPLRDRYIELFWKLKTFYTDCNTLRYLTSIIIVPDLPESPPFFTENNSGSSLSSSKSTTTQKLLDDLSGKTDTNAYNFLPSNDNQKHIEYVRQQSLYQQQQIDSLENELQKLQLSNDGIDWKAKYEKLLEKYNTLISLYQQLQDELSNSTEKINVFTEQVDTLLEYEPMLLKLQKQVKEHLSRIKCLEKERDLLLEKLTSNFNDDVISMDSHKLQLDDLKNSFTLQLDELKKAYASLTSKYESIAQDTSILSLLSQLLFLLENSISKVHKLSIQPILNADINWALGCTLIEQSIEKIDDSLPSIVNSLFSNEVITENNICKGSIEFQSFASLLENILLFLNPLRDTFEQLAESENSIACTSISFFGTLRSQIGNGEYDISSCVSVLSTLKSYLIETFNSISELQKANSFDHSSNDIFEELSKAAAQINAISNELKKENTSFLIDSTLEVTDALSLLMKYATLCQKEIVHDGKILNSDDPYLKNSKWKEGLISAAKAVVSSMAFLSEASKEYTSLNKKGQVESVLVGAKEVAAGTIQLVTAARVKSTNLFSPNQLGLEDASKRVALATSSLAALAKKDYLTKSSGDCNSDPFHCFEKPGSEINRYQLTINERNQQIEILALESKLSQARAKLALIRKKAYNKT